VGVLIAFPEEKSLRPITNDRLKALHNLYGALLAQVDKVYAELAAGAPMLATEYVLLAGKSELDFPIQPRESHQSPSKRRRPTREPKSTA
jgi:hypothetical protein